MNMEDPQILDEEQWPADQEYNEFMLATFWQRVGATLLDALVQLPVALLVFWNMISLKIYALDVLLSLALFLYKPLLEGWYGATLGKMWTNLKVVTTDMQAITMDQSFMRYLFYGTSALIGFVTSYHLFHHPAFGEVQSMEGISAVTEDPLWSNLSTLASVLVLVSVFRVAFDRSRQAWHDRIARTLVIKLTEPQASEV